MTHSLVRFWNALSIKSYVVFWVACVFICCAAVAAGWLRTERRESEMNLQIQSDVQALDAGRHFKARLLGAAYEDLLWRITGDSQFRVGAEGELGAADDILNSMAGYRSTPGSLHITHELSWRLKAFRLESDVMPAPLAKELRPEATGLLNAAEDYISLQQNDMARTYEVAQALRKSQEHWWMALMALAALLLGVGSLGLLLRVIRPVGELRRTAARFGAGDYSVRAQVARDDEIGALCRTLNGLADDIARSRDELERRVQERTAELFAANRALQAEVLARRRVENALRESGERFRLIMENSPDMVSILDRDLVYRWVLNPMPPHTPEEFIGKPLGCFAASPEDEEKRTCLARGVLETGQAVRFESSYRFGEAVRHFEVIYQPWRDAEGATIGVASYAHDITERRRAEEALRRSESLVRAITDSVQDAIYLKDREGRILFANPATLAIVGKSAGNVIGKKDEDFHSDSETVRAIQENDQRIMNSDQVEVVEETVRGPTGPRIYLSTKAPYHDAAGRVIGLVGTSHDITERRQAEEALRRSESLLRAITDSIQDAIYLKDREGRILFANPAALALIGKSAGDVIGKKAEELHTGPETIRTIQGNDERIMNSDRLEVVEETIRGRTGPRVCLSTKAPYHDATGRVIGLVGTSRDITERKRAEERIRESEEAVRALLNATTDTMALLDASEKVLETNEITAQRIGISVDQILGRRLFDLFAPKIGAARRARFDEAVRSRRTVRFEDERDGRWYDINIYPLCDSQGRVTRIAIYARDFTERKRAEQALRESEARFRSTFNNAPIGMTLVSPDNRMLQANRAHCEFLGYSERELIGKNIEEITYPEDREETSRLTRWMREGGPRIEGHQKRYVRKTGEVVWGEVSASVIRDADGKLSYTIAQIVNITERRRAEEALRESNETIQALLNATTDSVFLLDVAGVILAANETAARGWNRSVEQLAGACAYNFMTAAVAESRKAHFARCLESGQPLHFEDEHRGIWYDTGAYPIRDSQGKATRMAVFARDITERKRAEQALRESEHRYRELFEASPTALIEEDWTIVRQRADEVRAGGASDVRAWFLSHPEEALLCFRRIQRLDTNKAALRLFKAADKEELLANFDRLGCEETRACTISAIAGISAGNEFFEAETSLRTLTGEKRRVLMSISAAPVAEKSLTPYIVSLSDVTDLRRAQQEAVEQRQAAQLQRMESLAVTGRLAAGVAHEINNPLQGIVAQLSLLADELPATLRQGRRIELIHGGIDRIADIVRNLLQLHRAPPAGEESCVASSVIHSLADMISSMASSQRIRLEVSANMPEITIPMSANALTQVLLNLALNAIDAMPKGGVMQIEAKQTREAVLVSVSDTGVGIPLELRTRLFSPFFTTKGPKGTGLGLSVTHSLVTSAGGTIVVSDRSDGGTTFAICFENRRKEI